MKMKAKIVMKDNSIVYGIVDGVQAGGILSVLLLTGEEKKPEDDVYKSIDLNTCKKIVMTNLL